MAHKSWQQEEFSFAYVRAVASVAGFAVQRHDVDYDGVDLTVHSQGGSGIALSPRLDVQLKSATSGKPAKFPWSYSLKKRNYDTLRGAYAVPRVLVVVAMPALVTDWITQTPGQLALRHCAYWSSLRGAAGTSNRTAVTVSFPRTSTLSVVALKAIMLGIGQGRDP